MRRGNMKSAVGRHCANPFGKVLIREVPVIIYGGQFSRQRIQAPYLNLALRSRDSADLPSVMGSLLARNHILTSPYT